MRAAPLARSCAGADAVPFARVDGVDLYYEVDGPVAHDGRTTLVFAHGGEGTHLHWWQQVAALSLRYRCVTYDARGFGRSGTTPSAYGTDSHRVDLLGLLDACGIDRAVLIGQSMGGHAVSGVALHHPERVLGVVMGDTPFGFATAALAAWSAQMIEKLANGFDVIANCVSPGFRNRRPDLAFLFDALGRANPPRTGPRGLDAYHQMMTQPAGNYSAFATPTCFVVGDEDALTPPWLIEATTCAIPGAVRYVVPGAGHSVYFERADVFNKIVTTFVESVHH